MIARVNTIALNGLEILDVDLQLQIASGLPSFNIVGLPDKAVAESKERVRAALKTINFELPPKRITVNLAPADLLKEGSHFDLPIALAVLSAMGVVPQEKLDEYVVMGELGLDACVAPVNGVLPVAVHAKKIKKALICPFFQGPEAKICGLEDIVAPKNLVDLINHLKGTSLIPAPDNFALAEKTKQLDLIDVKGQETAKRALEIAAAGGHNMLMVGPPGAGKSMLAARLSSILPPMLPHEALETSMIHSVAGELKDGKVSFERPFRAPHHNASTPALVGGGKMARPGEISLAHNGVLFLDELPEFNRTTLEALRQPLENANVCISRVNARTTYPARFQLVAAMNPCKCGNFGNPSHECKKAPMCAEEYQNKISGPLMDRIDIHVYVPAVNPWDIANAKSGESSAEVLKRVIVARDIQKRRFEKFGFSNLYVNAQLKGDLLEKVTVLDDDAKQMLVSFCQKFNMSARAYHRTLRLARTIADLQCEENVLKMHVAEALSFRRQSLKNRN